MILKASAQHAAALSELGAETFYSSHKDSAPAHEIAAYMNKTYNIDAISKELANPVNIYHLIKHDSTFAGFSKIELTMNHRAIELPNVTKMDQIYLLDTFQGLKLGAKLLDFNINYSKSRNQNGMWLVVWIGNSTAINFYKRFGFRVVTNDQFQLTQTHVSPCYIMLLEYGNAKQV
jgi:diamine N-acetyltransferase